jgi:WhiB family transcriptional regulator, redox-sensing transcriptional regulator
VSPRATSLANAEYDWRRRAACRAAGPALFFPVGTTSEALVEIDQAKAVCRGCPVRGDCLEFAFVTNQDSGVWGGTSEVERRGLRGAWIARHRAAALS